ncbi:DUF6174 domain-containing protein [Patulibacter defluvii]|uniref:DUF6174 domain-containing protein n=1 Tax=Patulibacter defluvii TaxID=3095358 RepID=UPI002A75E27E|nr:DUF6174 domain-containing protein [Patulibacter sp. DM4]
MSARRALPLAAVVAALAVAGPAAAQGVPLPDQPDPSITDGSAQRALDAARAQWKAYGVRHYRMRVRQQCFCPPQYTSARTITVRRGKPVGRVVEHLRPFATVPRLFARLQEAIDAKVSQLDVRYGAHGVPRDFFVDRSRAIVDEERGVGVDRFRRLRGR